MENCKYDGVEVCSYDLKDEWGIYQQNKVVALKRAATNGYLRCTDCEERVYLAAGLIREPYFAHYDAKNCPYGKSLESEESRIGKRLIYHLLKNSFPDGDIHVRHRLDEGFYTSFFVITEENSKLAIDYRLTQLPIKQFDERKQYYLSHEIMPVFFLGVRQDKNCEQLNWYQQCVQDLFGYCIFFDALAGKVIFKRNFDYQVDQFRRNQVFQESYPIQELKLTSTGVFNCDFLENCRFKEESIKHKLQEQANQYKEEQLRQEIYYQQQIAKNQVEEKARLTENLIKIIQRVDFYETELKSGIRRDILLNCIDLIVQGNIDLVSEKYINYINQYQ